ncbi:hypothetical protein, partial [Pseudomonas viridiflava]|uniref:hypothetical protein n=1 Tax=Pseudomonas viridiflava TaxID=33069 RepID=UPI00197DE003
TLIVPIAPGGIPTRSVGTISMISSKPIMPMLVLSVIPESCCDTDCGRRLAGDAFSEAIYQ